jgi:hypothetical protein
MYEHCFCGAIPISCNPFHYPHKFFKKFHKTLVQRLTRVTTRPQMKKAPDRCQSGVEEGDNHKPPEEKQMGIFAD